MVQVDFLAANHVCIVRLCRHAHPAVIFAIAQLSCIVTCCVLPTTPSLYDDDGEDDDDNDNDDDDDGDDELMQTDPRDALHSGVFISH